MPKVWLQSGENNSIIVWHSTEPLAELLENARLSVSEHAKWSTFLSNARKREWLTVRNAIQLLLPGNSAEAIQYDENGKPKLADKSISISHSNDFIAVMVSEKGNIGIDIEEIGTRIERLSQKFLSQNEKQYGYSSKHIEKLHVMWGAKEVLFKIHSIGNLIFITDLLVHPFIYTGSGVVQASILKKGFEKDYSVNYLQMNDYMLVWGMG